MQYVQKMKNLSQVIRYSLILSTFLVFLAPATMAQDRNTSLVAQVLSQDDSQPAILHEMGLSSWKKEEVRRMRVLTGEEAKGGYKVLGEFGKDGQLTRLEMPAKKMTQTFHYNGESNLKKVRVYKKAELVAQHQFYYNDKGEITRSVKDDFLADTETETWYNKNAHPIRIKTYKDGVVKNSTKVTNQYDNLGNLVAQSSPKGSNRMIYNGEGQLIELRIEKNGSEGRMEFKWDGKFMTEAKEYVKKGEDYKLAATKEFTYNSANLLQKVLTKFRDENEMPATLAYAYDDFWSETMAMRGDDLNAGYGSPVVINWVNPDADKTVTAAEQGLKLELKPGVGQRMPKITDATLRHNGDITEREIGGVVLQKKGPGDDFFVEETLKLDNGGNFVGLTVETALGQFSSPDRYLRYRNPYALIKVNNVEVLSVGVSDYKADELDLQYSDDDAKDFAASMEAHGSGAFTRVRSTTMIDAEATKNGVEDAIRTLRGKTAAGDLAVIFFSGQGQSWSGDFFLKTHEAATDPDNLAKTAVSGQWLMEEIDRFRCPVVVVLDASHKSQLSDVETNLEELNRHFNNTFDNEGEIRIVITSSKSNTASQEKADFNNGVFTEVLLEGLNGKADEMGNRDGYVSAIELNDYVTDKVANITSFKQASGADKLGVGLVPMAKVQK